MDIQIWKNVQVKTVNKNEKVLNKSVERYKLNKSYATRVFTFNYLQQPGQPNSPFSFLKQPNPPDLS